MTTEIREKAQERKVDTSSATAVSAWRTLPKVANLEQLRWKAAPIPEIAVNEGRLLVADGLVFDEQIPTIRARLDAAGRQTFTGDRSRSARGRLALFLPHT